MIPGANTGSGQMGLGSHANSNSFYKRKYRWTFSLQTPCGDVPENLVKISSRPQLNIEETQIDFMHGRMWIPGKGNWETMTVNYYDMVSGSEDISRLYSWLRTVYEFDNPTLLRQSSIRGGNGSNGWGANAVLTLYDGVGNIAETWGLGMVFPTSVNFGDLAYDSSDIVEIELTLRYSTATYTPGSCMRPIGDCAIAGCNG
jgi:hypothetical protein